MDYRGFPCILSSHNRYFNISSQAESQGLGPCTGIALCHWTDFPLDLPQVYQRISAEMSTLMAQI